MRLSYSAARVYQECGMKYKLQYMEGYREKAIHSNLLFGRCLDQVIQVRLKGNPTPPHDLFSTLWNEYHPSKTTDVLYKKSDFDSDLISKDLLSKTLSLLEVYQKEPLSSEDEFFLQTMFWTSLSEKAKLMLEAHEQEVFPHIKSVLAVQQKIALDNGQGDSVTGYLDCVLKWKDGRTVLFDYKTSSSFYLKDSVKQSEQLTLYAHAAGIKYIGYIVLVKSLQKERIKNCLQCGYQSQTTHKTCNNEVNGKRCHGAWDEHVQCIAPTQVLIDEVDPITENLVLENFDAINDGIKKEVFIRNLNACEGKFGKCAMFDKCHKNDDSALIKKNTF